MSHSPSLITLYALGAAGAECSGVAIQRRHLDKITAEKLAHRPDSQARRHWRRTGDAEDPATLGGVDKVGPVTTDTGVIAPGGQDQARRWLSHLGLLRPDLDLPRYHG